jgi:hypothetical protein
MPHLHSFNLWNERTRSYDCECGAQLYETVLEAHAPYGSDIYRHRIAQLEGKINSIRDYCRTTPLDDLDPYTILRMIDGDKP